MPAIAAPERPKVAAEKPKISLSLEFKRHLQRVKAELAQVPVSKTDLYAELQSSARKPLGLESFLDKFWDRGNLKNILPKYMEFLAKSKKLSEEQKERAMQDLADLVSSTATPIKARRESDREYVGGLRGTGEFLKDRMKELDRDPEAVNRFHQFLTNGHFSDNPAQEDLKTSLSYQRGAYPTMKDLYEKSRNRMFMSGRSDLARLLDQYMLEYLEMRNLGLVRKQVYSLDEEREVRNGLIEQVFGTLNDFEKVVVRGLLTSEDASEKEVLANLRGGVNQRQLLAEVYRKYSRSLYRNRRVEELAALNRIMGRYVEITREPEPVNPYRDYSREQLQTKARELAEYLQALKTAPNTPSNDMQAALLNQHAYWQRRDKRQQVLAEAAEAQLNRVLELLDPEPDTPDEE